MRLPMKMIVSVGLWDGGNRHAALVARPSS